MEKIILADNTELQILDGASLGSISAEVEDGAAAEDAGLERGVPVQSTMSFVAPPQNLDNFVGAEVESLGAQVVAVDVVGVEAHAVVKLTHKIPPV